MNSNQIVKSFNADPRAKNRLKFTSAKERAKQASADVYRSYKRRTGVVTSAASREERVHHQDQFNDSSSRKKRRTSSSAPGREEKAVVSSNIEFDESEEELELETNTTFQMELDLARDRNASTLFTNLYAELVPLVGSLPEILHHGKKIVTLLLSYILSPFSKPYAAFSEELWKPAEKTKELYVVNIVTTDVLHLLSVLARDLRHEIHPYVHELILPRIVNDLINPPTTVSDPDMKQQRTLDITVVETAFRTLSYIFRYDTNALLSEDVEGKKKKSKKDSDKSEGCLEPMRKYYGSTLAHKAEFVRRLGAESFAPLVRKLRSHASKKKHIRRVIGSLATSASSCASFSDNAPDDATGDCYEPSVVMTSRQERASNDAIDGVALLLFYTIRGVPGRLHSKSQGIVKIILGNLLPTDSNGDSLLNGNVESYKRHVTFKLISQILAKARVHVNSGPIFSSTWDEIYSNLEDVIEVMKRGDSGYAYGLGHLVQIMTECISFRNGFLLKNQEEEERAGSISKLLQDMLEPDFYCKLGKRNQSHILKFLCAAWKVFPDHPKFAHRLCRFIPTIAEGSSAVVDPMLVLSKDLLPFISEELSAKYLVPEILKAAAKRSAVDDGGKIQMILHALATSRLMKDMDSDSYTGDTDDLFITDLAPKCIILLSEKKALVDSCLGDLAISKAKLDQGEFARLSYVARIIPFLARVGCDATAKDDFALVERIAKHITHLLKKLDKVQDASDLSTDFIVTKALLIEALACTVSGIADNSVHRPAMKKVLKQARDTTNKFLFQFPTSLLTVKSSAEMATAMKAFDLELNDQSNEAFDALNSNLRSSNHFLRLHTLRILNSYPQRPFVTDFNDIDLSGDLDEGEYQVKKDSSGDNRPPPGQGGTSSLSGACDIMETLLQIETTPVDMLNERRLTGAINRVEILARSGKLPVLYAEAAVNHMFGVMHIKFQSLWSASVRAIAALASAHELAAWPSMASQLQLVMEVSYTNNVTVGCDVEDSSREVESDAEKELFRHHNLLRKWDSSSGENVELFQQEIQAAKSRGRVSRHQSTDRITIFEQVWSVLESVPHLTTKKSRVIVPIFLHFLHTQYFLFHNDDPDAREFKLENHIEDASAR